MKKVLRGVIFLLVIAIGGPLLFSGILSAAESGSAEPAKIVQGGAILTVADFQEADRQGCGPDADHQERPRKGYGHYHQGDNNAYVAEEITGKKVGVQHL